MSERFATSRPIASYSSFFEFWFSVFLLNIRVLIATNLLVDFRNKVVTFPKVPLLDKFFFLSERIY